MWGLFCQRRKNLAQTVELYHPRLDQLYMSIAMGFLLPSLFSFCVWERFNLLWRRPDIPARQVYAWEPCLLCMVFPSIWIVWKFRAFLSLWPAEAVFVCTQTCATTYIRSQGHSITTIKESEWKNVLLYTLIGLSIHTVFLISNHSKVKTREF